MLKFTFLIFWTATATVGYAQDVEESRLPREDIRVNDFENFNKLRFEILNLIGAAKTRVWLVSDYLTDGEIVSALFLARYRKLDVKVLLGRAKLNSYMSRLGYLQQQEIPVFLKPAKFPSGYPTQVLTDNKLYKVGVELNFMNQAQGSFRLQTGTKLEQAHFIESFEEAVAQGIAPKATRIPLVGRPPASAPSSAWRERSPAYPAPANPRPAYAGEKDGSYNYDAAKRGQGGAPSELPRRLPTKTIMEAKRSNPAPALPEPSPKTDDGLFQNTPVSTDPNNPLENH